MVVRDMKMTRARVAVLMVVSMAMVTAVNACGPGGSGEDVSSGTPADVLAFASASGDKVLAAKTFRGTFENRDANEYNTACQMRMKVGAAVDLDRKLAFIELEPGQGTGIVMSPDTLYVRASALPGWTVDRPWLAVQFTDRENLANVVPALRLAFTLSPKTLNTTDASSPLTGLRAIRDTVTQVDDRGHESVGGIDTTRYDLTIDPAKAGIWTGGTTTTTSPTTVPAADAARARRQRLFDLMTTDREGKAKPVPDDVKAAFMAGDVEPLLRLEEGTTGTTMKPNDLVLFRVMAAGDVEAGVRAAEAATGTTIDRGGLKIMQAAIDPAAGGIGSIFQMFTTVKATVWVDGEGVLRRIDERVEYGGMETTGTTSPSKMPPLADLRLELSEISTPITETLPAATDVRNAADLPRSHIPTQLSRCDWRIPDTTR
jgi:hypothetical protein